MKNVEIERDFLKA